MAGPGRNARCRENVSLDDHPQVKPTRRILDRSDATEFLKGVVTFTVKDASAETIRIGYYGGLTKTSKAKPGTSSGGPSRGPRRGPGGPPGRGGPSIFSNPFAGLTQSSNELIATPRGEVQSLTGTSQLPYLLGNLSAMFFEPLPEAGEKQWTVSNGVSITEGGRSSRPPFFRPGPSTGQEKLRATASGPFLGAQVSGDWLYEIWFKPVFEAWDATPSPICGELRWLASFELAMNSHTLDLPTQPSAGARFTDVATMNESPPSSSPSSLRWRTSGLLCPCRFL